MQKEKDGNREQNILGILVAIVGIVVSFTLFYHSNVERIARQNQNYIADTAKNRAASLGTMFHESLDFLESIAVIVETEFTNHGFDPSVLDVESQEEIPESAISLIREVLSMYENRFDFDYLRFVDLHGRDFTSQDDGSQAMVSERDYFQEGSAGKAGITYVLDSKVTNESEIGFYAPVYTGSGEERKVMGVVVGFYGEEFIHRMLTMSLFDYPCDVLLCAGDGVVIYNTDEESDVANFFSALEDGTINAHMVSSLAEKDMEFQYLEDGKASVGYAAYTGEASDFYLVADFPVDVYHRMIRNANMNGILLLLMLTVLFGALLTAYVFRYFLQRKRMMSDANRMIQEAGKMITALASDYLSVFYVELDTDEAICYQESGILGGFRVGEHFCYSEGIRNYAETFVTDEYRKEFLSFVSAAQVRERLKKERVISYRYQVLKNGVLIYDMIRFAGVRHPEDRDDGIVHAVGMSFSNVDSETRKELEHTRALQEALVNAEAANKAKTAFLSNMSHEIRTPMNAIIGLDNIALSDTSISPSTREHLEKISTSAKHLLGIINDILDMSRIESGRMIMKSEEFSFAAALAQVNTMISGQCRDKGLFYECHMMGKLQDYYIGDDMKLRQVLVNILGNAVKFTPEGGSITLTVEEGAHFEGKTALRFVITDTGIGMSKEYLPKIFDSFSQEDSSSTNRYGSTGLGMPITKSIVELMNGTITVESEKGKGTTFVVTVPLLDSMRMSEEEKDLLLPEEIRVLVIDDDPIACENAKLVLGQAGIECDTTLSGKEALEMVSLQNARRIPYNLILVDWRMPEMDGLEVTKRIREEMGHGMPIILLTSYSWEDVAEEAKKAGVDTFVSKPVFASSVLYEFREALRQKKVQTRQEVADLTGRHILLAEDVSVNAEIMMMILSMKEMTVDHAINGKVAVQLFKEHDQGYYDAILMDMRMPEMDGLDATRAIRALSREDAKTIPIIALTANAFDEDVQRSMQAGLNAHLAKPVEPEVLFKTLEGLVKP